VGVDGCVGVWVCGCVGVGGWEWVCMWVCMCMQTSVHGWYTPHVHLRGEWHSFMCFYIHELSLRFTLVHHQLAATPFNNI